MTRQNPPRDHPYAAQQLLVFLLFSYKTRIRSMSRLSILILLFFMSLSFPFGTTLFPLTDIRRRGIVYLMFPSAAVRMPAVARRMFRLSLVRRRCVRRSKRQTTRCSVSSTSVTDACDCWRKSYSCRAGRLTTSSASSAGACARACVRDDGQQHVATFRATFL